jgi:hypothetical protein
VNVQTSQTETKEHKSQEMQATLESAHKVVECSILTPKDQPQTHTKETQSSGAQTHTRETQFTVLSPPQQHEQ